MILKKIPKSVVNYLNEVGLVFHCPFRIEKTAVEGNFLKAKIFNSYAFSDYQVNHFLYRITVDACNGEIILVELNGQFTLMRNDLNVEC